MDLSHSQNNQLKTKCVPAGPLILKKDSWE